MNFPVPIPGMVPFNRTIDIIPEWQGRGRGGRGGDERTSPPKTTVVSESSFDTNEPIMTERLHKLLFVYSRQFIICHLEVFVVVVGGIRGIVFVLVSSKIVEYLLRESRF